MSYDSDDRSGRHELSAMTTRAVQDSRDVRHRGPRVRTNDLDTSTDLAIRRVIPETGQRADDEDWGSWIDPHDERDRLCDREKRSQTASGKLKTSSTKVRSSHETSPAVTARSRARVVDRPPENSDINDMPAGTGIATVFLDRHLKVMRFTPAAKEIAYDRMAEVVEDARAVLDTLHSKQLDIQARDGRWYRMHVDPYGTLEDENEGVVVSFVDIAEHRQAEQEASRRLAEKEMLLKEVHHRVRNNTSSIVGLLSIQAQSIADSEARNALQGAIGRVESMNVLYDKLLVSEQYGASSVKDYLEDLADRIVSLFPAGASTTLEKRVSDFDVKSDVLFLVGLITNELLTNVMKYAFEGRSGGLITLSLEKSTNRVTLIVQDDGVGLPPGFDPRFTDGFGLSLVRMLSEQLNGFFSMSTQNGTRSVLEFDL